MNNYDFLVSDISSIKGIGTKTTKLFKKKNINTVFDLLWSLPRDYTDRTQISKIKELQLGKVQTIVVNVEKYSFPRIRNLPNKIICEDGTGKFEITYFNSREGYLRKIYPFNKFIIVSGKVSFFKNKYQMTNPDYVTLQENKEYVNKLLPKYSLTKGTVSYTHLRAHETPEHIV